MKKPSDLMTVRLGFVLLALAAAGAVYSFSTALGSERMLTIAVRQGVESVALKKVAERFSREHGVPIKIKEFAYADLFTQERENVRSHPELFPKPEPHSDFDVIMVDDPWMPALLIDPNESDGNDPGKYRLKELNETYTQDDGLNDFVEPALRVARYCPGEGTCTKYYGVPFVGNSQIFCYNADDIQDPASIHDWDQVKKTSEKLQAPNKLAYVTRIGPDNSIVTDFMPILWTYDDAALKDHFERGVHPFGEGKEQEASMAFHTMVELVRKQKAGGISVDDFDVAAYLATGHASMGIVWSAWAMSLMNIQNTQKALEEQRSADHRNVQAEHKRPALKCGGMPGGKPELGVWMLAIPSTAQMQHEAEEFIRYATSREQMLIAAAQGNPPARKSVLAVPPAAVEKVAFKGGDQDDDSQDLDCSRKRMNQDHYSRCMAKVHSVIHDRYGDLFSTQLKSLETARARPRSRCWTEIEKVLGTHLQELIILDATDHPSLGPAAEAAVSQANQDLKSLSEKRCWEFKLDTSHYH